jgi:predicted nucleic acid-binding protein
MPDYLFDSGILILHLRNQPGYPELTNRLMDEAEVYISTMTRLEIVRGMKKRERRDTFALLDSLENIPMTGAIADRAGELIRTWQERGISLGNADAVIAASALEYDLILATTNPRHFPMPELVVLQADEQGHLTQAARREGQ